jgi:putative DNA methylase
VRYYGQWMRDEAEKRIGHLYPKIEVTADMAKDRPDLKPYVGRKLTVIAWLWARTVKSPNPAFAHVDVPLASTFMLSTKAGKEAYVEPVIEGGGYRFTVKVGKPKDVEGAKGGTKLARANFGCLMSGAPISGEYIKAEGMAGRMGARLMAIVAEGDRQRIYLAPTPEHEEAAHMVMPEWKPEVEFFPQALGFRVGNYGMTKWSDLFTDRQIVALTTFCDLVGQARERVKRDAVVAGVLDDQSLERGGSGATAYADAVAVYLGFSVSKTSNRASTLCTFKITVECPGDTFGRQALPMSWDYAEANTVGGPSGSFESMLRNTVAGLLSNNARSGSVGYASQSDASSQLVSIGKVVSTDPPYYDNIGYADLSDFFYVWLRRSLRPLFSGLFATMAVPKADELVATPDRHGGRGRAEHFFLNGMTQAMHRLAEQAHPAYPVTIYYAFKQSESDTEAGTASTGWETFIAAVIEAGFAISGTWPIRTERENRQSARHQRARVQHRPRLSPTCSHRTDRHPPRFRHRPQGRTAESADAPCKPATSPRSTSRKPPSAPAWPSIRATRRYSTPKASRCRCAPPWLSSTRLSTKRWPSRKATSTPTAAGHSPGLSRPASPKAITEWPSSSPSPRTPPWPVWSRPASWFPEPARCAC